MKAIRNGLEDLYLLKWLKKFPGLTEKITVTHERELPKNIMSPCFSNTPRKTTEEIQKIALTWLIDYMNEINVEKLEALMSFITTSPKLPPWRLEKEIAVKFLPDDEQKLMPEATTCFNILYIPVVYESKTKFYKYMDIALDCESSGFSAES